jgi:hypothetical protein
VGEAILHPGLQRYGHAIIDADANGVQALRQQEACNLWRQLSFMHDRR